MNEDRMTPEALAEIANRAELVVRNHADWSVAAAVMLAGRDVPALLAEVERLTDENECLSSAMKLAQTRAKDLGAEKARLCEMIIDERSAHKELDEAIARDNARLRNELEAAKRDIPRECETCAHEDESHTTKACHECWGNNWEWRGVPANTPAQGATDEPIGGAK